MPIVCKGPNSRPLYPDFKIAKEISLFIAKGTSF